MAENDEEKQGSTTGDAIKSGVGKLAKKTVPELAAADQAQKALRKPGFVLVLLGAIPVSVIAVFLVSLLVPLVLVLIFLGAIDISEAVESIKTEIITNSPSNIPKGVGTTEVTFTVVVTNNLESDMTNVEVTILNDNPNATCAPLKYTIGDLAAGISSSPQDIVCTIPLDDDYRFNIRIRVDADVISEDADGNTVLEPVFEIFSSPTITIGLPSDCEPSVAPLKSVYWSGLDYNPPAHNGLDIATTGSDWNVYSPFVCSVTVTKVKDDGDVGYGVYVDLTNESGEYSVRLAHLERGSVTVGIGDSVNSHDAVGIMDATGCTGDACSGGQHHVHYEIRKSGKLENPRNYGALTSHP